MLASSWLSLATAVLVGLAKAAAPLTPIHTRGNLAYLAQNVGAKYAITVLAIGDPDFKRPSLINKVRYAQKHGYDLIISERPYFEDIKSQWSKLGMLFDVAALDKYEWIFEVDLDTVIMNMEVKIEDIVRDAQSAHAAGPSTHPLSIIVSHDCNGLNSGQFLLRGNYIGMSWLAQSFALRHEDIPRINV